MACALYAVWERVCEAYKLSAAMDRSHIPTRQSARLFLRRSSGASLIEVALVCPLLLTLLVGVVAMGRAFYAAIEVSSAASAGALYGTQNPTDTTGMRTAALADAANLTGMTVTAVYGCECSDGTSPIASCSSTPSCTYNVVRYVQVDTALSYSAPLRFTGVPSTLALKGTSRMRTDF